MGVECSAIGVTVDYVTPARGAGNRTQVLVKSSKGSESLTYLQLQLLYYYFLWVSVSPIYFSEASIPLELARCI